MLQGAVHSLILEQTIFQKEFSAQEIEQKNHKIFPPFLKMTENLSASYTSWRR